MRFLFILLFVSTTFLAGFAQVNRKIPSEKPRLIVGIHLSQFRNDFITRYWDNFSEGGIKKLVTRGTQCRNTIINYTNAEHGVGIATIATGSVPSEHGIVSDYWYSSLKEEMIHSIADNSVKTLGGAFENGKYSPHNLLVTTYTDEIKLASQFRSKVFSISMLPQSAVLSAGHTGDMAFWFDFEKGNFISSSYYADSLPWWVDTFNVKRIPDTYLEGEWNMLLPENRYSFGSADESPYEIGIRKQNTFPYVIDKLSKKVSKAEPYKILNYSPYGNTLAKDFAIQTIVNEELGMDDFTDVLSISFTSLELIASHFGPLSIEMEDLILRLDQELEHFIAFLDGYIGLENVMIYFTAEQGIGYPSEYLLQNNIPAGEYAINSAKMLLLSYLNNLYGKGDWVQQFGNGQIHLNTNLIEDSDIPLKTIQDIVADFLIQFHGVKHAVTSTALTANVYTSGINSTIQNGYNKKRSGDVFYVLREGWVEVNSERALLKSQHHNVPLLFYGWKIKREVIYDKVSLHDIAPTINSLLDINIPSSVTGSPIREILK